jgi:hypothetical protein
MPAARFAMVDDATALRASIASLLPDMRFVSVHGTSRSCSTSIRAPTS